jgi:hypothetical protein
MHSHRATAGVVARVAAPIASLLLLLMPVDAALADEASELRAVFIAKIVHFVEWPEGAFETDTDPIRVGVVGDLPYFDALDRVLATAESSGRSFVVRRLPGLEQASLAHIVIVADESRGAQRRAARALESMPVLSIGPSFRFAEYGGTIGMELYQGKIAFDVNHSAARRAGLRISSKVLRLATTVY